MTVYNIIITSIIIINGIGVILAKNTITAIINLIFVFIWSAISVIIIGAEFFGIILIIIYIGAIMILFLFVIMMLNLRIVEIYNSVINYYPIGVIIGLIYYVNYSIIIKSENKGMIKYYVENNLMEEIYKNNLIEAKNNLYLLGDILYNTMISYYIIYLSIILLLGLIGSMQLAMDTNYHKEKSKKKWKL